MIKFKFQLIFFIFIMPAMCQAQDLNGKTLMNIAGKNIEAGEFIRMYQKSSVPGKAEDIDSYLQQFISFKLKVTDAIKGGLDTTRSFKNELNGYREQLAQTYLTDQQTKESLLKKAYSRYKTEVNAWHILIACQPEASPADTLLAFTKANDIRERIINGESFEQVARGSSDDKSVMINGGNLGYFTAFQMIMPFEDAAWDLKKGDISLPVRTPYGYHIIRVTDKRPSKGKILVAHIMKAVPPDADEKTSKNAENEISRIYQELEKGGSFSSLAKLYSDHKESAVNGGKLNWFGTGEIISDFSEAAFSLTDTGKYTKPVRTLYGWHIIKLLDKKPIGTYEESKSFLESKLNQSYLNSISKKSLIGKLKKEYDLKTDTGAYQWFVRHTDTLVIQGIKRYPKDSIPLKNLYTFANQKFTTRQFAAYIEKRGSMIVTDDPAKFIENSLETRVSDHIIAYENSVLEKKYPDFRYLMNEFHDGILLFEISGKKVWNRVREDSTGLVNYYEQHKKEYLTPRRLETKMYKVSQPGIEGKLISVYKKNSRKADIDSYLIKKFNRKGKTVLTIEEGSWIKGQNQYIDKLEWTPGTVFNISGLSPVVVIKKIIEPQPIPLQEIRSEMMTGFQEDLETVWVRQLKEKYNVKVNVRVLEEVKKKLKK